MSAEIMDPQVLADQEEVDKHWLSYVKSALMLYMAVTKCKDTLFMAQKWNAHGKKMGKPAAMLLLFNAFVCVLVTVFKFTSKLVAPLYFLQSLSHMGFVLSFYVLTACNDNPRIRSTSEKLAPQLRILIGLYGFIILFGYFRLTKCSAEQPYPWAFVAGDVLFFVSYAVCAQFKTSDVEECAPSKDNTDERAHIAFELTRAQFERFYGKYKQMAIWHGVELLLGRVLFKTVFEGALICGGNGTEWHYRSGLAHLFLVLHLMGTMQALGTQSSILIKTVKGKKAVIDPKKLQ